MVDHRQSSRPRGDRSCRCQDHHRPKLETKHRGRYGVGVRPTDHGSGLQHRALLGACGYARDGRDRARFDPVARWAAIGAVVGRVRHRVVDPVPPRLHPARRSRSRCDPPFRLLGAFATILAIVDTGDRSADRSLDGLGRLLQHAPDRFRLRLLLRRGELRLPVCWTVFSDSFGAPEKGSSGTTQYCSSRSRASRSCGDGSVGSQRSSPDSSSSGL